jgi:hypothetical protein
MLSQTPEITTQAIIIGSKILGSAKEGEHLITRGSTVDVLGDEDVGLFMIESAVLGRCQVRLHNVAFARWTKVFSRQMVHFVMY